ncbi:hypothetical protein [Glutamicibacter uratoxydans]|uniref:hypothetical protein n=1 Tax=Glutamicibacter uratoxydans TaxID=43667 RepID=UPI003D6EDA6F
MSLNDSEFLEVTGEGNDDEPQDGRDGQPSDGGSSDDPDSLAAADPLRGTEAVAEDQFVIDPTATATESVDSINRTVDEEIGEATDDPVLRPPERHT